MKERERNRRQESEIIWNCRWKIVSRKERGWMEEGEKKRRMRERMLKQILKNKHMKPFNRLEIAT